MSGPWGSGPRPPRHAPARGRWVLWLVLALGVGALVGFLAWRFPDAIHSERDRVRLVYLVLLLALVSTSILAGRRLRLRGRRCAG